MESLINPSLSSADVARFQKDGFINAGLCLNPLAVTMLRHELNRIIANHARPGSKQPLMIRRLEDGSGRPVWKIINLWMASRLFASIAKSTGIARSVAALMGAREVRLWYDELHENPLVGGVNRWHQDKPLWSLLEPSATASEITAWIALDDVDESNGCMYMLPGSHRWGSAIEAWHRLSHFNQLPPTYGNHKLKRVACPVRMGEIHYHHGFTWHGSEGNQTDRPRRALALHFVNENSRFRANGAHITKSLITCHDGEPLQGPQLPLVFTSPGIFRLETARVAKLSCHEDNALG